MDKLNSIPLGLHGLILIEPSIFSDHRGYFLETYQTQKYRELLGDLGDFIQDNMSYSKYGTIRGLHYQKMPYGQAKLVRCVLGKIIDVAVDLRHDSETFGMHLCIELDSDRNCQLYIPKGFAHGFSVLSQEAIVEYKCDEFYHAEADAGIRYNDPSLNINWGIPAEKACVSDKDLSLPYWKDLILEGVL